MKPILLTHLTSFLSPVARLKLSGWPPSSEFHSCALCPDIEKIISKDPDPSLVIIQFLDVRIFPPDGLIQLPPVLSDKLV